MDKKPVLWNDSAKATGESQTVQGTSDGNLQAVADEVPLWSVSFLPSQFLNQTS